jgi:putative hydrolase of the HAD superfamily
MGIQVVIFDCGGVVMHDRDDSAYVTWGARLGLDAGTLRSRLYSSEAWALAERGQITEREFWVGAGESVGLTDAGQAQAMAEDMWNSWAVDEHVLALIDRVKGRYRVAMLSNATDILEERLEKRYGVADRFEMIVNSSRLGVAKPERAIYDETLRRLDVKPAEALFIDDRAENVAAAAALGMHVIWFVSPAELERQLSVHLNHGMLAATGHALPVARVAPQPHQQDD